jgi:hypothetical protein
MIDYKNLGIKINVLVEGDLWFVPIVFHEILEFSLIEIEIDAHQVISPVFGSDSLFSSWKPEGWIKEYFSKMRTGLNI